MIRLAVLLAIADLRRDPARAAAVTVLLLVAAVLPAVLGAGALAGAILAVVVAGSATAGAVALHEDRTRVLAECGAGGGAHALVAGASLAGPGAAAAGGATLVGLVTDGSPAPVAAVALALVVPVLVATVWRWATAPGVTMGRWSAVALGVLIAVTTPLLVGPLVLVAVLVGRRLGQVPVGVRLAVAGVAVGVIAGAAVLLSLSESFFDLGLLMAATAVPLTAAVGWLGATAVTTVATLVTRLGPTARLAAAPVTRRRRQLGPVAAVVAVVATVAAAEGVVGASFGAREEARPAPAVLGRAGTGDDQRIVVTTGLYPDEERELVAEAVGEAPVRVAVIDRVGSGSTELPAMTSGAPPPFLDLGAALRVPPAVAVPVAAGPSWVGVVGPEALGPLGLDAHADALARGDALVLNVDVDDEGGRVAITGGDGAIAVPAIRVSDRTGLLLPAVLVSEARATRLGALRTGGRVVVVPEPGGPAGVADTVAAAIHAPVADTASTRYRVSDDLDETSTFGAILEQQRSVDAGGDAVREPEIAPLDGVPALARSAAQGQARAVTFGALAVLVALAGTLLVVGGARSEDAVLVVQGAPGRFRVATAVVQTATVAVAGAALGALVGLGVPALAMALYNGRARDDVRTLDVPFVVPPAVVLVLALLPVLAAALAGVVVAGRGRPTPRLLADAART